MERTKVNPKVSVVITVLNEEKTISGLLSALADQTFFPSEIIIVDGGSTDSTQGIINSWVKKMPKLKLYSLPQANRSKGRNFGVSRSKYSIIAFTDAGCLPKKDWLAELIKPFTDLQVQVVSGFYTGKAGNNFEKCLVPYTLVMPDKAEKNEFFPATRSMAIRRSAWDKSGGFDPTLNLNEDYAYAHWLKKLGFSFHFTPKAIVEWYPRKNLWEAAKMFFYFSLGDIQAKIIRPNIKPLFIRYAVFIYLVVFTIENNKFFLLIFLMILIYLVWAINKNFRYVRNVSAFFWLPVIQVIADLSVMWGTIIGFLSRFYGLS